jgi:hypothetical protein
MKTSCFKWAIPSGVLALALGCASLAIAAGPPAQGDTSGPAAGTPTTPSTAVQKQASPQNGGAGAGAPGVAGKPGAESGDKPTGSTASGPSKTH